MLGTLLSITVGRRLADAVGWPYLRQGSHGAVVELAVAAAVLVWAHLRFRRSTMSAEPGRRARAGPALIVASELFSATAFTDPTFGALVVVAGRGMPIWQVAIAHTLWISISQLPLTLLLLTIVFGRYEPANIAWFQRWWERARTTIGHILTIVLTLAGLILALDGVRYLAMGKFLIP